MQKRLFNVRLKMNQGRKANQSEVQNEFKRFNDPKFDARQRYAELQQQERAASAAGVDGADGVVGPPPQQLEDDNPLMTITAEAAERRQRKVEEKEKNMATFGLHALVTDRTYKSYKNGLSKLPTKPSSDTSTAAVASKSNNALLNYGQQQGAQISAAGVDRLSNHLSEVEDNKRKNSRRQTAVVLSYCRTVVLSYCFTAITRHEQQHHLRSLDVNTPGVPSFSYVTPFVRHHSAMAPTRIDHRSRIVPHLSDTTVRQYSISAVQQVDSTTVRQYDSMTV